MLPEGYGPTSWHTIESGQAAEYVAHERIVFLPGFKAEAGSHFIARIEPCSSCLNGSQSMVFLNTNNNSEETSYSSDDEMFNPQTNILIEPYTKKIKLYPNPNLGTFQIEANFPLSDVVSLKVVNALGAPVYETQNLASNEIQLLNAGSGFYFVVVILKNGTVLTQKMMVQR